MAIIGTQFATGSIYWLDCRRFVGLVIAYDPFMTQEAMAAYGVEKVSLEEAFQQGDYISSHLPLNAKTPYTMH